jgi:hypothetical protein
MHVCIALLLQFHYFGVAHGHKRQKTMQIFGSYALVAG